MELTPCLRVNRTIIWLNLNKTKRMLWWGSFKLSASSSDLLGNLYFLQTCQGLFFFVCTQSEVASRRGQTILQSHTVYSNTVCSDPHLFAAVSHLPPHLPSRSKGSGNKGDKLPAACPIRSEQRLPGVNIEARAERAACVARLHRHV